MTLFFLLVLIGNYARGGGGPSTKFYCWHVLTYFYKKIFRRELVISFCPVGTSIFSIMAEFGNVGSGFGWTSLCKTGWDENAGGQLASEMMATSDDQPVCRYTHCWDIAGIILRLCNMLMTLVVYAVCTLPDISGIIPRTHRWVLPCQGWMIFWARARLNCSNILWASFTSVVFFQLDILTPSSDIISEGTDSSIFLISSQVSSHNIFRYQRLSRMAPWDSMNMLLKKETYKLVWCSQNQGVLLLPGIPNCAHHMASECCLTQN